MRTADLLLEIGTEEIPAGYIPGAVAQLAKRLTAHLSEHGVEFDATLFETFATPRRLAVLVRKVALEQTKRTDTKLGPAVAAAFDDEGQPTAAARGFARSLGVDVEALQRLDTDRGPRLALAVEVGGASSASILMENDLLRSLLQLGFPKTMRWIPGDGFAFARPIRWLVCLLGDEVVPLRLAHLQAGRVTRGHRTLNPGPVEIPTASAYAEVLARADVLVRPQERRESIRVAAQQLAAQAGGRLHEAEDLLEEVTYLSEHPFPVLGTYDPSAIEVLPAEVIVTALRAHQRYFSVESESGRLLPRFITFRDGGDRSLENVAEGNERVLRARLGDALFYWNEDRSLSSDEKLEKLARIVWLEGFGSVREKCERIKDLALALREELAIDVSEDLLARAALLCKTDLATEMIRDGKEFTKLQGTIGRYYALEAGEPQAVAEAIEEHLRPRFAADRLPADPLSTLVALADRLDSVAGCTLAGFAPTGSQDPYALRRQALAVLRILLEHGWHLDLTIWIDRVLRRFPSTEESMGAAVPVIEDLFWSRLETLLNDLPKEIVRAILAVSPLDPVETIRAARALARLQGEDSFDKLLVGAKRCRNILVKEKRLAEEEEDEHTRARLLQAAARSRWEQWQTHVSNGAPLSFDATLMGEPAEMLLLRAAVEVVPGLQTARDHGDHGSVFRALADLGGPISRYFDEVRVNSPDEALRRNRLAFLEDIHYLFVRFADLSNVPSA